MPNRSCISLCKFRSIHVAPHLPPKRENQLSVQVLLGWNQTFSNARFFKLKRIRFDDAVCNQVNRASTTINDQDTSVWLKIVRWGVLSVSKYAKLPEMVSRQMW